MSTALLLALTLLAAPPGLVELEDIPDGAQVYARSDGCDVRVEGNIVHGQADCAVVVAIVSQDGSVTRTTHTLIKVAKSTKSSQEEDAPLAEDAPAPVTPVEVSQDAQANQPSFRRTPELWINVSRDLGDFGFSAGGLGLGVRMTSDLHFEAQWERGVGRSKTQVLEGYPNAIEQTSDLFLAGIMLRRKVEGRVNLRLGVVAGPGTIKGKEAETEREVLAATTQPIFVVRPQIGLEAKSERLALRIVGAATWATGHWFEANDYGSRTENVPPERDGIIGVGIQLGVGVTL